VSICWQIAKQRVRSKINEGKTGKVREAEHSSKVSAGDKKAMHRRRKDVY
jgi:hypothetical protein